MLLLWQTAVGVCEKKRGCGKSAMKTIFKEAHDIWTLKIEAYMQALV